MSTDPVLGLIEQVVALEGGIAESPSPFVLETLLDDRLASALKVPAATSFTTKSGTDDAQLVTFDSPVIRLIDTFLGDRGAVSAVRVRFDGYMKKSNFENPIRQKIDVLNATLQIGEASLTELPYLSVDVAYTAESEDKRMGRMSFVVNGYSGVAPVDIGDALLWDNDRTEIFPAAVSMIAFDTFHQVVARTTELGVQSELKEWQRRLDLRRKADQTRLDQYYGNMISELQRRIDRHTATTARIGQDRDRLVATQREYDRKSKELVTRYAIDIDASLYSCLVALLPAMRVQCQISRKRYKREFPVIWSPFTKAVEAVRCELCFHPATSISLDDQNRILCHECMQI
jgi:hypothetical protein